MEKEKYIIINQAWHGRFQGISLSLADTAGSQVVHQWASKFFINLVMQLGLTVRYVKIFVFTVNSVCVMCLRRWCKYPHRLVKRPKVRKRMTCKKRVIRSCLFASEFLIRFMTPASNEWKCSFRAKVKNKYLSYQNHSNISLSASGLEGRAL